MDLTKKVFRDIEEALDELRDATINRNYKRASRLKKALELILSEFGYTLVEHPLHIYVIDQISHAGGGDTLPPVH